MSGGLRQTQGQHIKNHPGRRNIGGARDVMHITGAHQGVDIGFVGLWRHRVAQKDHPVHPAFRKLRANLQVAAMRARKHAFNLEPMGGGDPRARRARGQQRALAERGGIFPREFHDVVFLAIVRNQRNTGFHDKALLVRDEWRTAVVVVSMPGVVDVADVADVADVVDVVDVVDVADLIDVIRMMGPL